MLLRTLLLATLLALAPGIASAQVPEPPQDEAQEQQCTIQGDRWSRVEEGGQLILIFTDPFVATCEDGTELRANTGRLNETMGELFLDGNVFFQDTDRTLTSNQATYNTGTERLWATGNVVFVNRIEGSTLRGPELEYFRANEERPEAQAFATLRPTLTLPPRDSVEADEEPLQLVADRIVILGDDDLSAFGSVVITRTDLEATSDEATYNSATESLELRRDAVIRNGEQELAGEVINAELTDSSLEFIHARTGASLLGEDLEVTAPDLQLFFASDTLQRVTARVPDDQEGERAVAVSRSFRLEADSLDAFFVDQLLKEVHAIGSARGETIDTTISVASGGPDLTDEGAPAQSINTPEPLGGVSEPDSTLAGVTPPADSVGVQVPIAASPGATPSATPGSRAIIESDWIRGDTILAYFEPTPPDSADGATDSPEPTADGASEPLADRQAEDEPAEVCTLEPCPAPEVEEETGVDIRRLIAVGDALSLYRLAAEGDPPGQRSNVNLLAAERIELDVVDGELEVATAIGLQRGIYLEATTPPPAVSPAISPPPPAPTEDAPVDTAPVGVS